MVSLTESLSLAGLTSLGEFHHSNTVTVPLGIVKSV